jgi:hypothetical protein
VEESLPVSVLYSLLLEKWKECLLHIPVGSKCVFKENEPSFSICIPTAQYFNFMIMEPSILILSYVNPSSYWSLN